MTFPKATENPPLWMPNHEPMVGQALPSPYRQLLFHDQDMTSTLSRHHGETIQLRVLEKIQGRQSLERRVVLVGADSGQPVEYGAIRIELAPFPKAAQKAILDCQHPLGTILAEFKIIYSSHPQSFFRLTSTPDIDRALNLPESNLTLYGRRNRLLGPAGNTLAVVVEILPLERARTSPGEPAP